MILKKNQYANSAPSMPPKMWGLTSSLLGYFLMVASTLVMSGILLGVVVGYLTATGSNVSEKAVTSFVTENPAGALFGMFLTWLPLIAIPFIVSKVRGTGNFRKDIGLSFTKNDIFYGISLGGIMLLSSVAVSNLLKLAGLDVDGSSNTTGISGQHGLLLIITILGASVGAPFFEEIFFRGFMLRGITRTIAHVDVSDNPQLESQYGRVSQSERYIDRIKAVVKNWRLMLSIIIVSVCFGILHFPVANLTITSFATIASQIAFLGVFFGISACSRTTLGTNMIAHCFFNSLAIIAVFI